MAVNVAIDPNRLVTDTKVRSSSYFDTVAVLTTNYSYSLRANSHIPLKSFSSNSVSYHYTGVYFPHAL